MQTSCIKDPSNDPFLIIRNWQVLACDGNHCAAALLSFFTSWHNHKLKASGQTKRYNDVAETHGNSRSQYEGVIQWHSVEQLKAGLLGMYSSDSIQSAILLLCNKGFVQRTRNPVERYHFDRTGHYELFPSVVNTWINANCSGSTPLCESVTTRGVTQAEAEAEEKR
jgi:hypothetical protein